MNRRTCLLTCTIILCLVAASVATAAPYKIYEEIYRGGSGSVYYIGAVDGDTCYTGQITLCAQQWGDEKIGGTALRNHGLEEGPGNTAKCSLPLGGHIYMTNGAAYLRRQTAWTDHTIELAGQSGQVWPDAICTDGTYIFGTQGSGGSLTTNLIHKFSVNHAAGSVALLNTWSFGTSSTHRFRSVTYYNGKLYTVNHKPAGQIYEIDPSTGTFTQIAACPTAADSNYQVVRYGSKLFVVGLNCNLYTFTYSGGAWSLTSTAPTGYSQNGAYGLFGIGVKGDGTNAKYAWITAPGAAMSFWDLDPTFSPATLGEARKMKGGYPVAINQDLAVTKVGTNEFWAQDLDRASAVHFLCAAGAPALNKKINLNIQGGAPTSSASGEKEMTLSAVPAVVSDYAAEPLFVTNKALGPGPDGDGLANDGLLVRVTGVFKSYDNANSVIIDDGSGVANDVAGGPLGLKVFIADPASVPHFDEYIMWGAVPCNFTVTGIVRLEKKADGTIIRRIDARSEAEVLLAPLP